MRTCNKNNSSFLWGYCKTCLKKKETFIRLDSKKWINNEQAKLSQVPVDWKKLPGLKNDIIKTSHSEKQMGILDKIALPKWLILTFQFC